MAKILYLVDGSGFIFRAYHALPPLSRPDGTPVGAVLGFTNMLVRLLKDRHADHIAVIFDADRRNYRHDIYPEYKANRPPPPDDLVPQFPLMRTATRAFSLPSIELAGYEADDLIATYARLATAQGMQVVIVSSDKDLLQLLGPNVQMMDPIKQTLAGPDAAIAKFGVPPEKVAEVQALCGDATDNVPGVDGIGPKTAAQLITEFGNLETLLAQAHTIKQEKRRETLLAQADRARLSYRLVTLDDHVPIPVPLDDLCVRDHAMPDLSAFLAEQGFKSVLTRMGLSAPVGVQVQDAPSGLKDEQKARRIGSGAASGSGGDDGLNVSLPPAPVIPEPRYTLMTDERVLAQWMEAARERGILAIDTETTHLTPAHAGLVGISISIEPGVAAYIPVGHQKVGDLLAGPADPLILQQMKMDVIVRHLKPVLEDRSILKIGHNMKYDMQILAAHGMHMAPVHDTMLMSYDLFNTARSHGLQDLSQTLLGVQGISYDDVTGTGKSRVTFDLVPIDRARDYAAEDADFTRRLYDMFYDPLRTSGRLSVYEDIDRPLIPVIAEMERTGMRIDPSVLKTLSADFGAQMIELESDIHRLAGTPFNVGSPKQLGDILFSKMGLTGGARTKTGDWSTAADTLESLAEAGHDIAVKVLEWRGLSKLKSTYTDALVQAIHPETERVHTSYHMAYTATARLSSTDPNLQNIPIRTSNGRKIRRAFVTDPGYKLISVDYSQIELRLIADIAGIPALKQAFQNGVDIHTLTAAEVFGLAPDQVTSEIRRSAKAINFGIIYGISGFGLARQLGCDVGTANNYIKQYLHKFKELQDYFDNIRDQMSTKGYVESVFGRRIVIEGAQDKNPARRAYAYRQAINAPIQGTAADLMRMAMCDVHRALKVYGFSGRLLMQVHDELVLEAPEDEAQAVAALVKKTMESVHMFDVPIIAEAGIADNWDDAH